MRSLDLLACHLIGDFCLQDHERSQQKLHNPRVRAEHVSWYCLPFLVAGIVSRANSGRLAAFLILLWISHYTIDSKRWLPNDKWPPGTIISDQALHMVQLAILNRVVGRSRV